MTERNVTASHNPSDLGELEQEVMQLIWKYGEVTADRIREELLRALKDSTVRTVLRRLEEKGYVVHELENRTFLYRAAKARPEVAARAVKRIVDWVCNGSVEALLVGMVDENVLDRKELKQLAEKIASAKRGGKMIASLMLESAVRTLVLAAFIFVVLKIIRIGERTGTENCLSNGALRSFDDAAAMPLEAF